MIVSTSQKNTRAGDVGIGPEDSDQPKLQTRGSECYAWGGHFLKKDPKGWYEVYNHTVRTKCSQALREALTNEQRANKAPALPKSQEAGYRGVSHSLNTSSCLSPEAYLVLFITKFA